MACLNKTVEEQLAGVSSALADILQRSGSADARVVGLRDEAHEILIGAGLAYRIKLHCDRVGVHTSNRSDTGVEPQEELRKLAKFARAGFSFKLPVQINACHRNMTRLLGVQVLPSS